MQCLKNSLRKKSPKVAGYLRAGTALTAIAALAAFLTPAQDRGQARSMVISKNGIVAAESPLAAQAGVQILEHGGNAVDAAIAANAAMGVVAPMMNGMGGDLFVIVYDAKAGKLYGLNASGWAPKGLTPEYLHKQGVRDMPQAGINSVTVPGVVDGWQKLSERFGRRKLSDDLGAAIRLAQDGFPVPELTSAVWALSVDLLRADDAASKLYLPQDRAPKTGDIFRNPELAESLREVAAGGRDAYYQGAIATKILDASKRHGGVMTAQDLVEYSSEWVEPMSTTYRDWTVYEMPPNGQGLAALEMLNILETQSFGQKDTGFGSAKTLQAMIEAKKLAYTDLAKYIGDPHKQNLPVATLLSKAWAIQRAKLIDGDHANCDTSAGIIGGGTDTTYLSVVDRDGNMVSLIQSNYSAFGSGIVAAGTGFVLHNRGGLFTLDAASPNLLAGRKRPLHTIIPGFAQNGDTRMAFGIMGGWNQAQAHAQFISDIADFKMNIQAALEAPRFTKKTFSGCDVEMENRFSQKVRDELSAKGHKVTVKGSFSGDMGGGQAVLRDFATDTNYGASDPRKDGEAIPELPAN
jgi:gamma-glutamyltranspeptidase / glutathione hydrolase